MPAHTAHKMLHSWKIGNSRGDHTNATTKEADSSTPSMLVGLLAYLGRKNAWKQRSLPSGQSF
jgi:hypothetical protein